MVLFDKNRDIKYICIIDITDGCKIITETSTTQEQYWAYYHILNTQYYLALIYHSHLHHYNLWKFKLLTKELKIELPIEKYNNHIDTAYPWTQNYVYHVLNTDFGLEYDYFVNSKFPQIDIFTNTLPWIDKLEAKFDAEFITFLTECRQVIDTTVNNMYDLDAIKIDSDKLAEFCVKYNYGEPISFKNIMLNYIFETLIISNVLHSYGLTNYSPVTNTGIPEIKLSYKNIGKESNHFGFKSFLEYIIVTRENNNMTQQYESIADSILVELNELKLKYTENKFISTIQFNGIGHIRDTNDYSFLIKLSKLFRNRNNF